MSTHAPKLLPEVRVQESCRSGGCTGRRAVGGGGSVGGAVTGGVAVDVAVPVPVSVPVPAAAAASSPVCVEVVWVESRGADMRQPLVLM